MYSSFLVHCTKICSRIFKNIKFSYCSQVLLNQGTIISPLENLEKTKMPFLLCNSCSFIKIINL